MSNCSTCGQPLPEKHVHETNGDWSQPFTDINHRMFQTSRCKDTTCNRLMVRELKKDKAKRPEVVNA